MTSKAFISAVLVTVSTMPLAQASTDITMATSSFLSPSRQAAELTAFSSEGAISARTGEAASSGGAIYSPFAGVSTSNRARGAAATRLANADNADMSLTIVVALAGLAVALLVLRRVRDAFGML